MSDSKFTLRAMKNYKTTEKNLVATSYEVIRSWDETTIFIDGNTTPAIILSHIQKEASHPPYDVCYISVDGQTVATIVHDKQICINASDEHSNEEMYKLQDEAEAEAKAKAKAP